MRLCTSISKLFEYNQAKSVIHGHIDKTEVIANQDKMENKQKTKLLAAIKYWDSINDTIKSILTVIKRKIKINGKLKSHT